MSLLGIYPRKIKTCLHENLYTNVHGSFNCPKLATIKMSITGTWVKQCVAQPQWDNT